jgi:hypothetical protein
LKLLSAYPLTACFIALAARSRSSPWSRCAAIERDAVVER